MQNTKNHYTAALAAAVLALGSPNAIADVASGTLTGGTSFDNGGTFQLITAPAVLGNNQFDDDNVRAFNEQQDVTLTDRFILDIASPSLATNVLAADSVVSSHYVIYDPDGTNTAEGTITFDEPVLGIITSNLRFNGTDNLLGNPGTNYAIGAQGLEEPDLVTISGSTITYSLRTSAPGDAIRVITGVDPILALTACEGTNNTLSGAITGGDALTFGGEFVQLCAPIGPVGDDNFDSFDLFAFEEQQAVELTEPLAIDATTSIPAGEVISSYYVIWDPVPNNTVQGTITFPDDIVAVIVDRPELQASTFLGDASAVYLNPGMLGLENGDDLSFSGDTLTVDFFAGSPGDSVRVILGSASVNLGGMPCVPEDVTLTGAVTGGAAASLGGMFTQLCEPIGPVGNNNFQSNDLFAYEELQNVVLAEDLVLDEPVDTVVPGGTVVSSYYVAYDPAASRDIVGTVTFPRDIFGLATSTDLLNASDELGNPTAVYLNPDLRGLEPLEDSVAVSGDTLNVSFEASSPGDYIRVIIVGADEDQDGVPDDADNCIAAPNADQIDTDDDGFGNACDADFDNNCVVNFVDLGVLRSAFFSANPLTDLNNDGVTNFVDLGILRSAFFAPPGPSGLDNDCD